MIKKKWAVWVVVLIAVVVSLSFVFAVAPNQPAVNSPTDGSTGVSTSPNLNVTVTDNDSDAMNVSFFRINTWNITSAVYESNISSADPNVRGLFFKADGSKVYQLGLNTDKIYQHSLSVPWDISTAVYERNISTMDTIPLSLFFKSDGTEMYEVGTSKNKIYQSSLFIPWNISSAVYKRNISTNDFIGSIAFNFNGTKMYEGIGFGSYVIQQYSLSDPWNISSAVYESNLSTTTNLTINLFFKADGSKMYGIGTSTKKFINILYPTHGIYLQLH